MRRHADSACLGGNSSGYAVVWREGDAPVNAGKLELGGSGLSLHGSRANGALARRRIRYDELVQVRIGRSPSDRINGDPSVILDRRVGPPIVIGAVRGLGVVFELGDLLAELTAETAASASCLVVVVPIEPGAGEQARRLIEAGPPFEPEAIPLERHRVYLTEREVVFLFEGHDARSAIEQLARRPRVWKTAAAWKDIQRPSPPSHNLQTRETASVGIGDVRFSAPTPTRTPGRRSGGSRGHRARSAPRW